MRWKGADNLLYLPSSEGVRSYENVSKSKTFALSTERMIEPSKLATVPDEASILSNSTNKADAMCKTGDSLTIVDSKKSPVNNTQNIISTDAYGVTIDTTEEDSKEVANLNEVERNNGVD